MGYLFVTFVWALKTSVIYLDLHQIVYSMILVLKITVVDHVSVHPGSSGSCSPVIIRKPKNHGRSKQFFHS